MDDELRGAAEKALDYPAVAVAAAIVLLVLVLLVGVVEVFGLGTIFNGRGRPSEPNAERRTGMTAMATAMNKLAEETGKIRAENVDSQGRMIDELKLIAVNTALSHEDLKRLEDSQRKTHDVVVETKAKVSAIHRQP